LPDSSEEAPLLAAAYQQISVLNTQLAHLYTELTMVRTEAEQLRTQLGGTGAQQQMAGGPAAVDGSSADNAADVQKQSQQIADLVSDIRHLQLDLEYHQQKLDQMIEQKQQLMKDLKKSQQDNEAVKLHVEEQEQLLKHRDVDIASLKQELRAFGRGGADAGDGSTAGGAGASNEAVVSALRSEAAAKDSALIVSHYELHKEKLMRDRLEQKNLKLMERMQKLMMVVETMRKDNVHLERSLASKERSFEERDLQLRQMTSKAKILQKTVKASKYSSKNDSGGPVKPAPLNLDLDAPPSQSLPPLTDRSQWSTTGGGRQSGMSTPRTPTTPYRTR